MQIYRGARPTDVGQIKTLQYAGVKTVIDLQGGDLNSDFGWLVPFFEKGETPAEIGQEKKWVTQAGMNFVNVPLNATSTVTYDEALRIKRVLQLMNDPSLQPVYVHCAFGLDRTGLVVALSRVLYQHWDALPAYREMHDLGHSGIHQITTISLDDTFWSVVMMREFFNH